MKLKPVLILLFLSWVVSAVEKSSQPCTVILNSGENKILFEARAHHRVVGSLKEAVSGLIATPGLNRDAEEIHLLSRDLVAVHYLTNLIYGSLPFYEFTDRIAYKQECEAYAQDIAKLKRANMLTVSDEQLGRATVENYLDQYRNDHSIRRYWRFLQPDLFQSALLGLDFILSERSEKSIAGVNGLLSRTLTGN